MISKRVKFSLQSDVIPTDIPALNIAFGGSFVGWLNGLGNNVCWSSATFKSLIRIRYVQKLIWTSMKML